MNESLPRLSYDESLSCVCTQSLAQFREDCVLFPLFHSLTGSTYGRFVELGALDGYSISNTYALERCVRWKGLLIEANPSSFEKLRKSDRIAAKEHAAVCRGSGYVNITKHGNQYAGIPETMSQSYVRRWGRRIPERTTVVTVPCRSLTSMMLDNHISEAEFLSLDVQGAEETVLRATDLAMFKVVMVEMDGLDRTKDRRVDAILRAAGFLEAEKRFRVPYSRVYVVNKSHS